MKKHPVDDLFARKLADWQPSTSPDVWKRIEDRQEKKSRRLIGWHWYAAASLTLLLMVGYVVWQNQSTILPDAGRGLATVEQPQQPETNTSRSDRALQKSEVPPINSEAEKITTRSKVEENILNQNTRAFAKVDPIAQPQRQEPKPVLEDTEVAAIQKKEIGSELLIPDNKAITSLQPVEARLETTNETLAEQTKGRVIIAHIETDKLVQEDPKSSKFIRILRQLKNAKEGEAIEWDEVGFNPKKLVARADERLRDEEEKISKKYQELKDKTKL
ncbi:hypothetical protein [Salmonirosea aquatica]|uniref:Uncharacterized protein n=1 Tax=Salmonirosea aquatica TaxID=2654236 RepID=A0A7C9FY41_9BACT|nr:hypothetical protein [Cytophagaceae bacterium SJW1-29]